MKKLVVLMVILGLAGPASAALVARYDMDTDFGDGDAVLDGSGNGWHGTSTKVTSSEGVAIFPGDAVDGWIQLPDPNVALGLEGTISATVVFDGDDAANPIDTVWYDADADQVNKKALFVQVDLLVAEVNSPLGVTIDITHNINASLGTPIDIEFSWKDGLSSHLSVDGVVVGVKPIPMGFLAPLASRSPDAVVLGKNAGVNNHHLKGSLDGIVIDDAYTPLPPPADCATVTEWGFRLDYDFQPDCHVDEIDLNVLIAEWLSCMDPSDEDCDHPWETDPNSPFLVE